jgi:hypothetical protein
MLRRQHTDLARPRPRWETFDIDIPSLYGSRNTNDITSIKI